MALPEGGVTLPEAGDESTEPGDESMEPGDESMEPGDVSMKVGGAHFQQVRKFSAEKRTLPGLETAWLRLGGMLFRERAMFFPSKSTRARPDAIPLGLAFYYLASPWQALRRGLVAGLDA